MLDPRIYRTALLPVVLAVIVLAFSLEDQQAALSTNIVPDAFNGSHAYATMRVLAREYPSRQAGSVGDDLVAGRVTRALRGYGFHVSRDAFVAPTPKGTRTLQNVVGVRAGGGSGSIVIVSHRDALGAPAAASLSGTAVMLELARVLAGQTLHRTLVVASTSGSVGAAGTQRLIGQLSGPVDAVIVLGDLAGTEAPGPVVLPWSNRRLLAPPALRNTLGAALSAQTELAPGGAGLPGQVAHLAFPMSATEQAPFNDVGEPAVLLSLSGGQDPSPGQATSPARITGMGRTVLQALTALESGASVPSSSSYLLWAGKVIPSWAIRLLVLVLIMPVLAVTIDGLARARRKGHPVSRWMGWALAAGVPFILAALLVKVAKLTGWIGPAPAAPVNGGTWPLDAGGIALLVVMAGVIVGGLVWLRRLIVRALGLAGSTPSGERPVVATSSPVGRRRELEEAAGRGAGPAAGVLVVLCIVALAVWVSNPFAALLVLPALHLWIWVVTPDVRLPLPVTIVLLLLGLAPIALVATYFAQTLGLGPLGVAWEGVLLLAGGAVGLLSAIEWAVLAGCAVSVVLIALRAATKAQDVPVTVRGPISYAGPGSLGGTKSALRR
ncbi:MAG: hypothetical protein ACJ764_03810 [Solirubrobacteraceae bacterium]